MFRILIIENVKTKAFHTMSPFYNSHFWCGRVYQGHKNILTSTLSRNRFLFPWETLWIGDQYWLKTRMWFFPLPIKIWGEFFDSHCLCEHDPIYGSLVIIVPVIRCQREVKKNQRFLQRVDRYISKLDCLLNPSPMTCLLEMFRLIKGLIFII